MYLRTIIKNEKTMDVSAKRNYEFIQTPLHFIEMIKDVNRKIVGEDRTENFAYCTLSPTSGQNHTGFILELQDELALLETLVKTETNPFALDTGLAILSGDTTIIVKRDDITSVMPSKNGYTVTFTNKVVNNKGCTVITKDCKKELIDYRIFTNNYMMGAKEFNTHLRTAHNVIHHIKTTLVYKELRGLSVAPELFPDSYTLKEIYGHVRFAIEHIVNTIVHFGYSSKVLTDQALSENLNVVEAVFKTIPSDDKNKEDFNNFKDFVLSFTKDDRPVIDKLENGNYPQETTECIFTFIDVKLELLNDDGQEWYKRKIGQLIPTIRQYCFVGGYNPECTISDMLKSIAKMYRHLGVYEWCPEFMLQNTLDFDFLSNFVKNR